MTDYNNGLIHGWNGGECPVHPETVVEVWFRNGGVTHGGGYDWSHTDEGTDIIAFRVIKAYVEPKVIWVNEYADGPVSFNRERTARNYAMPSAVRTAVKYVEVKE